MNSKMRDHCIFYGHKERECFNSVETKGKSCFVCRNCGMYLGTIHPLDNADKSEEPSQKTGQGEKV